MVKVTNQQIHPVDTTTRGREEAMEQLQQQQQQQEEEADAASRLLFPCKLLHILDYTEQRSESHIVSWTSNGEAFMVHNKHAFEARIMPRCVLPSPAAA
jgi:HSF-type DNA-binding